MILYRLVLSVAALWMRLRTPHTSPERERLEAPPPRSGHCLWIHAASNGELTAARTAVEGLIARGHALIITTNSLSARTLAGDWGLAGVDVRLAPFDDRATIRRFLDAVHPDALIVIENELWPERLTAAAGRGIPVLVLGGRLSSRSARLWSWFPGLARRTICAVHWLAPQDEASARRFSSLGLSHKQTGPILALKSLVQIAALSPEAMSWPRHETLLGASTHEGEELALLDAVISVRKTHPQLRLILAPRHPRRREEIEAMLRAKGLRFSVRSRGQHASASDEVYLADTLGEMARWYAAAGMTFVGGSLTDRGGHTPFEPAAMLSAILHGPHVANFADAYAALDREKAAVVVREGSGLSAAVRLLAGDKAAQQLLAKTARRVLDSLESNDGLTAFFIALDQSMRH